MTHGSRWPSTDVREAAVSVCQAGSDGVNGTTSTPCSPSERALAANARSSSLGRKARAQSRWGWLQCWQRDRPQSGSASASAPSASGSGYRAKKRRTSVLSAGSKRSSETGMPNAASPRPSRHVEERLSTQTSTRRVLAVAREVVNPLRLHYHPLNVQIQQRCKRQSP